MALAPQIKQKFLYAKQRECGLFDAVIFFFCFVNEFKKID